MATPCVPSQSERGALVFFSRKREVVNRGHFLAIVGLTLVNAAVAVFWR